MSVAQVTQRSVFGCARRSFLSPSASRSCAVFLRLYSGILERAARSTDFADVGEEGRMKCAEGGEEPGVVDGEQGEEVGELEREGTAQEEAEERRRKGKEREGRR
jgi:hypothetical protein